MEKTIVLLLGFIMAYSLAQAQNATIYSTKSGEGVNKLKAAAVDSIITVRIPGGTFTMGSPGSEADRAEGEIQHQVTLTSFRMSKYEITNSQYAAFLNAKGIGSDGKWAAGAYPTQTLIYASSGSTDFGLHYTGGQWVPAAGYENHPVILVTWYGATEFAKYVGGRLPTEAEWEYACRANTSTPFSNGSCLTNVQANYDWSHPYSTCINTVTTPPGKTLAVGSYPVNAFGLYDMHGNAWEWCSDWFGTYPTTAQANPTGPAIGTQRVGRGGGWTALGHWCRSARRGGSSPDYHFHDLGFRVVKDITTNTIFYVKENGTGDGSSWANASGNIQAMIDLSIPGDQVWVAKGTYTPTKELEPSDTRTRTLLLRDGVILYGGFAGTETAINQRVRSDLDGNGKVDSFEFVNETLLNGDIDGVVDVWTKTMNPDGKTWTWTVTGNEGNCYRVVTGQTDFSNTTYFDGFSIKGGKADTTNYGSGGGIYAIFNTFVSNCMVSNCYAVAGGGGIHAFNSPKNCMVSHCSASSGGGIDAFSSPTNCTVTNCSAVYGGGIYVSNYEASVTNCMVSNCSAGSDGGGILVSGCCGPGSLASVTSCTVTNCIAGYYGGGIYASARSSAGAANCVVANCTASSDGGGIYTTSDSYFGGSSVNNCAVSNIGTTPSNIIYTGSQLANISPDILDAYVKPTSFVGTATTVDQNAELLTANWRLREGSPCIDAGTGTLSGTDLDGNPRVQHGIIDIGAYEYTIPTILMPVSEDFNAWTDFEDSNVLYKSATINGAGNMKWVIENQKAVFSRKTNLTTLYEESFFTYQIDTCKTEKVYLWYNLQYVAHDTTNNKEYLDVEVSTDFRNWTSVANYAIQNGTISNMRYVHEISSLVAGKAFFVRFRAHGQNTNNIEQWEIDDILVSSVTPAIDVNNDDKLSYTISSGNLLIRNLDAGATVQLFEVSGKLLAQKQADANQSQLLLPQRGVYVVKIKSPSGLKSGKIVW